jgi:hypothetical protein
VFCFTSFLGTENFASQPYFGILHFSYQLFWNCEISVLLTKTFFDTRNFPFCSQTFLGICQFCLIFFCSVSFCILLSKTFSALEILLLAPRTFFEIGNFFCFPNIFLLLHFLPIFFSIVTFAFNSLKSCLELEILQFCSPNVFRNCEFYFPNLFWN